MAKSLGEDDLVAELSECRIHGLRVMAAERLYHLVEIGVLEEQGVADILGHQSLTMSKHYGRQVRSAATTRKAFRRMSRQANASTNE